MAKSKSIKCVCHECEIDFQIKVTSHVGQNQSPQICPFCGDSIDVNDDRPLLRNFDEYDDFDEDEYYKDEDDIDE